MPAIGELAPDFELLNQDGESVRLGDLRGRRVILFAYPKAATPGCTTQACGLGWVNGRTFGPEDCGPIAANARWNVSHDDEL